MHAAKVHIFFNIKMLKITKTNNNSFCRLPNRNYMTVSKENPFTFVPE